MYVSNYCEDMFAVPMKGYAKNINILCQSSFYAEKRDPVFLGFNLFSFYGGSVLCSKPAGVC